MVRTLPLPPSLGCHRKREKTAEYFGSVGGDGRGGEFSASLPTATATPVVATTQICLSCTARVTPLAATTKICLSFASSTAPTVRYSLPPWR